MKVTLLADYPQHVSIVAKWIFDEWGREFPDATLDGFEDRFRTHLNRKEIPLTVLAMEGDLPVGTASLVFHDLKERQDLSPWLAAVYVQSDQRGQGVGSKLVKIIELLASQLDVETLYLFTPDQESFYTHLGWEVYERTKLRENDIVIMEKEIF